MNIQKIAAFLFLLFFVGVFFLYKTSRTQNLSYEFKGEVQNIQYDIKGFAYLTINNKIYDLSYPGWVFDRQIQKGDTLEKRKNSFTIKLTKKISGEVIIFGHYTPTKSK